MRGDLLYRCRMCGLLYTAYSAPDVAVAVTNILGGIGVSGLYQAHPHADGSIGIAELIGGKLTPPPEPESS